MATPSFGEPPGERADAAAAAVIARRLLARAEEPAMRAVVFVLALAEQVEPDDLRAVVVRSWPDLASGVPEAMAAVEELPAVIAGRTQWGLAPSVALALRSLLRSGDMELYTSVFRGLAELERGRLEESGLSTLEHWLRLARFAYYIAPVDIKESSIRFGEAFDHAPSEVMTACRLMLSGLVAAQEQEFRSGDPRVLHFFWGFRAYVTQSMGTAKEQFDLVLAGDERDSYRAIALHLRAKAEDEQAGAPVRRWLQQSVNLSRRLGLVTNEVMAQNSHAYSLLAAWREGGGRESRLINVATAEAERAVTTARSADEKSLIGWSSHTLATCRWLKLMGLDGEYGPITIDTRLRASEVRRLYEEALNLADAADDLGSALETLNALARVQWSLGEEGLAVQSLRQAADRLVRDPSIARQVRRLAQTTGRYRRGAARADYQGDLQDLSERFDSWERSLDR